MGKPKISLIFIIQKWWGKKKKSFAWWVKANAPFRNNNSNKKKLFPIQTPFWHREIRDLIVQVERVAVHLGQMEKRTYSGLQMQFWLPSPSPPLPKIPRLSFPVCTRH